MKTIVVFYILLQAFGLANIVKIRDIYQQFDPRNLDTTLCVRGKNQSPINILTPQTINNRTLTPIRIDLNGTANIVMKNVGISIALEFTTEGGVNNPTVSGGALPGTYKTNEIHYHWGLRAREGSEHKINCEPFELELHMVNVKALYFDEATGSFDMRSALKDPYGVAVLVSLVRTGPLLNQNWTIVTDNLKYVKYMGREFHLPPVSIDQLRTALPWNTWDYYRYQGSLTIPMCDEAVIWTVFSQIVELSARQVQAFRELKSTSKFDDFSKPMGGNFRPTQEINGRRVYRSFFQY